MDSLYVVVSELNLYLYCGVSQWDSRICWQDKSPSTVLALRNNNLVP
jgi:hypothetical protein